MNRISNYIAVFLDQNSKAALGKLNSFVPKDWVWYGDHMTINVSHKSARSEDFPAPYGELAKSRKQVTLVVTHIGLSDKAIAVKVEGYPVEGKLTHVTLATPQGGSPKNSNLITNWKKIKSFTIHGTIMGNGDADEIISEGIKMYHGGHDIGDELILKLGHQTGKYTGSDAGALFFTPTKSYAKVYMHHPNGLYQYILEDESKIFDISNPKHIQQLQLGFTKDWKNEYSSKEDAIKDWRNVVQSMKNTANYGAADWATASQYTDQIEKAGFDGAKFLERSSEVINQNEDGIFIGSGNPIYSYAIFRNHIHVQRAPLDETDEYSDTVIPMGDRWNDQLDGGNYTNSALYPSTGHVKYGGTMSEDIVKRLVVEQLTGNGIRKINVDGTELPIVVVPRQQWAQGKTDTTEYSQEGKYVRVRDDYDYKNDPLGNMRHELMHYMADMNGVQDDNKPYPQNNIEQRAYTNQFKYLQRIGYKDLDSALQLLGKEHHKDVLQQYWGNPLSESVLKEDRSFPEILGKEHRGWISPDDKFIPSSPHTDFLEKQYPEYPVPNEVGDEWDEYVRTTYKRAFTDGFTRVDFQTVGGKPSLSLESYNKNSVAKIIQYYYYKYMVSQYVSEIFIDIRGQYYRYILPQDAAKLQGFIINNTNMTEQIVKKLVLKEIVSTFPYNVGSVQGTYDSWTDRAGDENLREIEHTDINKLPFVKSIEQAGGKVYQVGGAVRDSFLNTVSKDLDIMVSGLDAQVVISILSKYGNIAKNEKNDTGFVGGSFAVIKFKPFGDKEDIDVALARTEKKVGQGYGGFEVTANPSITLNQDLERRDFTVNAIAKDIHGQIYDPFNGQADIKNKIIRMVSPKAFADDPLRMIRALQFSARFGFTIEPATWNMIRQNADDIKHIKDERFVIEFDKMVHKTDIKQSAELLVSSGLYRAIFGDDFKGSYEQFPKVKTLAEFIFLLTKDSKESPSKFYAQRFGNWGNLSKIISAFELTRKEINTPSEERWLMNAVNKIDPKAVGSFVVQDKLKDVSMHHEEKYPRKAADLAVTGKEIDAMGITGGQHGQLNTDLLNLIYNDQLENTRDAVMGYIQQNIDKYKTNTPQKIQELTQTILQEDPFDYNSSISGWISPDNTYFYVPAMNHRSWIQKKGYYDYADALYAKWVRASLWRNGAKGTFSLQGDKNRISVVFKKIFINSLKYMIKNGDEIRFQYTSKNNDDEYDIFDLTKSEDRFRLLNLINTPESLSEKSFSKLQEQNMDKYKSTPQKIREIAAKILSEKDIEEISAYHGSPHSFDKFTTDKMGTGEGVQAYGWGLYFTGKEEIAKEYAQRLRGSGKEFKYKDGSTKTELELFLGIDKIFTNGFAQYTASGLRDYLTSIKNKQQRENTINYLGVKTNKDVSELQDLFGYEKEVKPKTTVYSVEIHKGKAPEQYDFLRWDMPPTENQLQKIAKLDPPEKLSSGSFSPNWLTYSKYDGQTLYKGLSARFGSDKEASLFLLKAGIDGIKYPTQYLSKGTHDDSFNYVVFDENAIEITNYNSLRENRLIRGVGKNIGSAVDLYGKGLYLTDSEQIAKFYGDEIQSFDVNGKIYDATKDFTKQELKQICRALDAVSGTNAGTTFIRDVIDYNGGKIPEATDVDYKHLIQALSSNHSLYQTMGKQGLLTNEFNPDANIATLINKALVKLGYIGLKYSTNDIDDLADNGMGNQNAYVIFDTNTVQRINEDFLGVVAYTNTPDIETVEAFKNPKSIKNLIPNIRGFIDAKTGDLFVINGARYFHNDIVDWVNKKLSARFPKDYGLIYKSPDIIIPVQREGNTDVFKLGELYPNNFDTDVNNRREMLVKIKNGLALAKQKNPSIEFIPQRIPDGIRENREQLNESEGNLDGNFEALVQQVKQRVPSLAKYNEFPEKNYDHFQLSKNIGKADVYWHNQQVTLTNVAIMSEFKMSYRNFNEKKWYNFTLKNQIFFDIPDTFADQMQRFVMQTAFNMLNDKYSYHKELMVPETESVKQSDVDEIVNEINRKTFEFEDHVNNFTRTEIFEQRLHEAPQQQFKDSDILKVERAILAEYGETNVTQCGYISPSGYCINIRGAGGNDHRNIMGTIENLPINWGLYNGEKYAHSFSKWLYIALDMGFIRVIPESGNIEMRSMPTQNQFTQLREFFQQKRGESLIDVYGDEQTYLKFGEGTPTDMIIEAIKRFFLYGEKPEQYDDSEYWNETKKHTQNIVENLTKTILEVRHENYKNYDIKSMAPINDDETLIVYHGFSRHSAKDAKLAIKFGLSGQKNADRTYSYETVNNPKGLFVSIDFDKVKKEFAGSGIIIEFATKVSNLEAPVWAGGGSYFVQGDYTSGFSSDEEREAQRIQNRDREQASPYPAISQSQRPELAQTLFQNAEKQALFVGNLNPNMIRAVWVNETLMLSDKWGGQWVKMSRNDFLRKYYDKSSETGDKYYDITNKIFRPNDDFNLDQFKKYLADHKYSYDDFVEYYIKDWDDYVMNTHFYPKQIAQIKQMFNIQAEEKKTKFTKQQLQEAIMEAQRSQLKRLVLFENNIY